MRTSESRAPAACVLVRVTGRARRGPADSAARSATIGHEAALQLQRSEQVTRKRGWEREGKLRVRGFVSKHGLGRIKRDGEMER